MTVKEALKARFDFMMEYYSKTEMKYPRFPWSSSIDQKIYVGEKDKSGWIGWQPLIKDVYHDFLDIEDELGVKINSDVKEYFNSYWFLELSTPFNKFRFSMRSVPPGEEFKHTKRIWKEAVQYFGKDNYYVYLGCHHENKSHDLLVENNTGSMFTLDHDTMKLNKLYSNLPDLLYYPMKAVAK